MMTDIHGGTDEGMAEQRLRLTSLESCEERIRNLREQECDLEVEQMAAQAALQSMTNRLQPNIDTALAARIGRSLDTRHRLEDQRRKAGAGQGILSTGSRRERDELRAAHAALQAWLEASPPRRPGAMAGVAKLALLIVVVVTVWAAIAVHPAFLLLLVAVAGPVSFVTGRGQDADWRRVGARRRFTASGLTDIDRWDEENVGARLLELESALAAMERDGPDDDADVSDAGPVDAEVLAGQIIEEDRKIASGLAAAGLTLDDAQGETGDWLRLVARADRAHESLERVKSERQRSRTEAAELRSQLLRYLHSHGVKPTEQPDTAAAIAQRLDRLSESR
jgi:hypothetical protein